MSHFQAFMKAYDFAFRAYMRLCALIAPNVCAETIFGSSFHCDRRDFIQRRIAFFGLFEPNLTFYLRSVLREGDVFIDVGANIGYFSLLGSSCVGSSGKVHSIEASPVTHDLLARNIALNDACNITTYNAAATQTECVVEIVTVDRRNIGMNRVVEASASSVQCVQGMPLLAIVGDVADARVIKIDVEGVEDQVLPDVLKHIAHRGADTIVVAEICPDNAHLMDAATILGFHMYALPNDYSISHLATRRFLHTNGEEGFATLRQTDTYISSQFDYIFSLRELAGEPPASVDWIAVAA